MIFDVLLVVGFFYVLRWLWRDHKRVVKKRNDWPKGGE